MVRADLNSLVVFFHVVEAGSFSAAARRLKMPVSTVSRRVAELEESLGVRLLRRSTRSLRLTSTGAEVLAHAKACGRISETVAGIASAQAQDGAGALAVAVAPDLVDGVVVPIVAAFQDIHPGVRVRLLVTDQAVGALARDADLAFHAGSVGECSLVARKLFRYSRKIVASPAYLNRRDPPRQPRDLPAHRVLGTSQPQQELVWRLRHVNGGAEELVTLAPHLDIDGPVGTMAALLAGLGIGEVSPFACPDLLREGRLVAVLPDWHLPRSDLSLVHPGLSCVRPAVRAFKAFAERAAAGLLHRIVAGSGAPSLGAAALQAQRDHAAGAGLAKKP